MISSSEPDRRLHARMAPTPARTFGLSKRTDDELLAPNALGFLPVVGSLPGAVWRRAALADDPLRTEPARVREHRGAVRLEVVVCSESRSGVGSVRRAMPL